MIISSFFQEKRSRGEGAEYAGSRLGATGRAAWARRAQDPISAAFAGLGKEIRDLTGTVLQDAKPETA
jgi:hypothetical protein